MTMQLQLWSGHMHLQHLQQSKLKSCSPAPLLRACKPLSAPSLMDNSPIAKAAMWQYKVVIKDGVFDVMQALQS